MNEWNVAEGTGWIDILDFGRINPRRDNVAGGRYFFTAMTSGEGYAAARGPQITEGPETWHYEPDQPFHVRDPATGKVLEMTISLLPAGRYAVKYRPGEWPNATSGGGWA
ncbi:hypothetical protein [Nocardioides alcanivorans]|uniref:hypothetical protein n=1 Tax=Nocardioides alcanivorans TaxID=2897352 RepID=UPI001F2E8655|nr:hypothetical protein [Nocardioides alcanivorans]